MIGLKEHSAIFNAGMVDWYFIVHPKDAYHMLIEEGVHPETIASVEETKSFLFKGAYIALSERVERGKILGGSTMDTITFLGGYAFFPQVFTHVA